jgi:HAD superfamily hydrolase (TIGR01490 family)
LSLAIFDLDETLIATDSDHAWGEYVVASGVVDADEYTAKNNEFYESYKRGELDIDAYLTFSCAMLAAYSMAELNDMRQNFIDDFIAPKVLSKALALVEKHRSQEDHLMIITATNQFITEPIAALFDISTLIAPVLEICDGRYTGQILGTPSFGAGKVTRLFEWLATNDQTLSGSFFYSDSHNDLPLLQEVTHPIAVDPDELLRGQAEKEKWPIISLRD